MSGAAKVWPLSGNQRLAVDPGESVWLSASAGTGKTQVLSARVLRLLLEPGVSPSQILCLTFTKAGAAEMALRIKEVLASWVRASETALAQDLIAIGADHGPEVLARARTLFAQVLDCPGGGLRIDTIHAFSQWLLSAFPAEAGLVPGVRAMEDRDRELLLREVLAALLLDAQARGDGEQIGALEMLSLRLGPDAVPRFLLRCAEAREAWEGPGGWQGPLRARVEMLIGLPVGTDRAALSALCTDDAFAVEALRLCLSAYRQWPAKTGQEGWPVIADWLAADAGQRLATLADLHKVLFTQKDTVRSANSLSKFEEHFVEAAEAVLASTLRLRETEVLIGLADWLTPVLTLGRAFARAWEEAKEREGLIDFDDQIRRAAGLLGGSVSADWIRYKLDRRFDHILVDEAQDTNAAQWRIIEALTGDFFTGQGAHDGKLRTVFVVGDYKQAIFRFQGTSPENFEAARLRFRARMVGAARNATALPGMPEARELCELGLDQSFRTAQSVLDFVDSAIAHIGHSAFGLVKVPEEHVGDTRPGHVAFWKPVGFTEEEAELEEETGGDGDVGEEGWLSGPERDLADKIATQVRSWLDHGFPLVKGRKPGEAPRRAGPGDVMVLVRKRRDLAGLIVARLFAQGVPVAGVDRLRLGAPLAVRDLMAALRFAAQPLDDLNLACLLTSPLIGWSQAQLLEHGWRDNGAKLWAHLRRLSHPDVATAMERLLGLLALADFEPPQALLHWLLSGPWQGRKRLVARLGEEANDPIDELVNAAHAYATGATPSLAGFIAWFDAGDGELKREAGRSDGLVRVMTVHGSKGLQAPIVILADAAGDPAKSRKEALTLADPHDTSEEPRRIPLPGLRKEETVGRLAEEAQRVQVAEMQEHWRLLYVAMTRAEEALFITGSLGAKEMVPADDSWYARLEELIPSERRIEDPIWGYRLEHGALTSDPVAPRAAPAAAETDAALPAWLTAAAAPEPRPPRPLAPSALGEDLAPDPPFPPGAGKAAARRGTLIHKLLERMPDVPADRREDAALRWLARNAADLDGAAHEDITGAVLRVVCDPQWQDLFAPGSLAEVPVAALVGERVVAGTIDRLLVMPDRVRIVDFKTARRPPGSFDQVPLAIVRQMAAYAAALEAVYPGRAVEAALLYTQAPRLILVPPEVLAREKAALIAAHNSL